MKSDETLQITFWPVVIHMLSNGGYCDWRWKQKLVGFAWHV